MHRKPGALRVWWSQYRHKRHLPPKPKIDKSVTSGRVGLQIKKIQEDNPRITIRDTVVELQKFLGPGHRVPQKSEIHRYLQNNDLIMIKLLKKPLVSAANIRKRIDFAISHLQDDHQLQKLTRHVIWSDETAVRKKPKGQEIYFRCHSSVDKENLPVNYQIQQGGFMVMFWGCFSSFGLGPLVALEGNQNQHSYKETLQRYLLPEIEAAKREFGIDMTFMQDNAPCHKTNMIKDFLATNKVATLDWPPQSPDMNPIENLWHIIKVRRQKKYGFPHTKVDLIEQIFQIWEEVDGDLLANLANSVEKRLREVVRMEGRPTKY